MRSTVSPSVGGIPTAHAGHDGRTRNAGVIQRRVYSPIGREPDEAKDRSQLKRFFRSQRWEVLLVETRISAVLSNEVYQGWVLYMQTSDTHRRCRFEAKDRRLTSRIRSRVAL
jgi:hypothetical protein